MKIERTFSTKAKTKGDTTKVVASTGNPDRYSDIVVWDKSADLENYKKNPVVQFGHNYDLPPVGKTVGLEIDNRTGNLIAEIQWDDNPDNKLGQTVARQFREGYLSAVSVGFQPGESVPRRSLPKDHPAYGEKGALMSSPRLLEISAVPIPANAEALAIRGLGAVTKHILNVEENEDSYVVTYAKMAPVEDEDDGYDDEEDEEMAFDDDEDEDREGPHDDDDEDKEHEPDHDDDEDDLEEDDLEEDDDDEEEKAYRLHREIRDVLLDLLSRDPVVRSMVKPSRKTSKRKSRNAMAELFGIDN